MMFASLQWSKCTEGRVSRRTALTMAFKLMMRV